MACKVLDTVVVYGGKPNRSVLESVKKYFIYSKDVKVVWDENDQRLAEEECRRKEEEERTRKIRELESQRSSLQTELANLKGLFKGKRRKELTAEIEDIESRLRTLRSK